MHGGMRLRDPARNLLDLFAVGDVALLELGAELRRDPLEPLAAAGEEHAAPASARECTGDRLADAA
jgi:hypothetical protein